MSNKRNLSTQDILTILVVLLQTGFVGLIAAITGLFRACSSGAKARTYKQHVIFSAIKYLTSKLSGRLLSKLSPNTLATYEKFAKQKDFEPMLVNEEGVKGGWIGSPQAENTILWFHGGGYAFPAQKDHFKLLSDLVHTVESHGQELSALIIEYDLTSESAYPRQLEQAVAALRYLIEHLNKPVHKIILGGDSAGGNLALALLSHMTHPHPNIPAVQLPSKACLKGAVLISPWVTFSTQAASFARNAGRDCLNPIALSHWSNEFLSQALLDNYNSPLNAPEDWWSEIPVKQGLVTAGEDEVLVDDIVAMVDKLKGKQAKIRLNVAEKEFHDAPVLESLLGFESETSKVLKEWVVDLIQAS